MSDKPANQPSILIVDDEAVVRELLFELLSDRYTCSVCASSESALNELNNGHYAVMISDIDMPGGSGLKLTLKAKEIAPNTAVVLTTGNLTSGYAEKALSAGACGFIEKPFDLSELESLVMEAVEQHRAAAEKKLGDAGGERRAQKNERRLRMRDYQAFGNEHLTMAKCH